MTLAGCSLVVALPSRRGMVQYGSSYMLIPVFRSLASELGQSPTKKVVTVHTDGDMELYIGHLNCPYIKAFS